MLGVSEGGLVFQSINALCSNESVTVINRKLMLYFNMLTFLDIMKKKRHILGFITMHYEIISGIKMGLMD